VFREDKVTLIAGPCSVESREQVFEAARSVKEAGIKIFRGGAYKPRTSPYSFQGLGDEGLELLVEAGKRYGLMTVTEVVEVDVLEKIHEKVDILQIGARNMDNYSLLKKVGQITADSKKWVLLKRGFAATIEEFLLAAEYILSAGNPNVILCERGIRTFENSTRFTLDLNAVPVIKKLTTLPVVVDVSHGTGRTDMLIPMSRAAIAAGADGVMIEAHPNPKEALCDGQQSLPTSHLKDWVEECRKIASALGKSIY
jgi:3-deoxy-7-phosphoheptulonate synthase